MEVRETSVLLQMVEIAGLPRKGAYSLREVSKASGAAYSTLADAAASGRLKTFLPPGCVRGRLVKPDWFDEWWTEGCNAGASTRASHATA